MLLQVLPVNDVLQAKLTVGTGGEVWLARVKGVHVRFYAEEHASQQPEYLLLAAGPRRHRLDLHKGAASGRARAQDPDLALFGHHFGYLLLVAEERVGNDLVGAGEFEFAKLTF